MLFRKYHRQIALFCFIPLLIIAITGIFLQFRSNAQWIQPSIVSAPVLSGSPLLSFDNIVGVIEPESNIEQIIYRPQKNNIAMRLKDGTEVQINAQTGEILKRAKRLTGLLTQIHEGNFAGNNFLRYFFFIPSALGLIFLIISGLIIYPKRKKRVIPKATR
jgi:uncharacterized iron-regulated membrane protein